MTIENAPKSSKPWQFKPGNPGGGRPKGSRTKIAESFLDVLYQDFQTHGAQAIADARAESPLGYVKIVAGLLPQKIEVATVATEMTDEELVGLIRGSGNRTVAPTPSPPGPDRLVN